VLGEEASLSLIIQHKKKKDLQQSEKPFEEGKIDENLMRAKCWWNEKDSNAVKISHAKSHCKYISTVHDAASVRVQIAMVGWVNYPFLLHPF